MQSDEEDLYLEEEDEKYLKWKNVPEDRTVAIEEKIKEFEISRKLPWIETFLVHSGALPTDLNPDEDFQREDAFYDLTLKAAQQGQNLLKKHNIPIERPGDYFAEMIKTDDHMEKIREVMLKDQDRIERAERNRKLREMKKFGKQVQHEVLQERSKKKKAAMQMAHRHGKSLSEAKGLDDFEVRAINARNLRKSQPLGKNPKRLAKDARFGFGGKKRQAKRNTAESAADMSSYPGRRMKQPFNSEKRKGGGKKKNARPGKSTRQKMKSRS
ncbi:hypothetical protein PTSG_03361 [Salpingoeca rosetta]|uniref:rRNA-processing protein EBP2 n=1 Tax=Salpingoeca rosetta (strain ATCC 50818 / BSB-021) TaxID=946362 RepID=F2U4Y4_SALR5|nr:uncharacterized protein PTSG_03361 [Salpingoeca rosetta]EGD82700.1 hypothetical protein PTSG_03361 [Salpingoeca rosetta]|eukprot:XP_004995936.1 hypothetical protein PTSG_03361 [Salpingoeca rosetta]